MDAAPPQPFPIIPGRTPAGFYMLENVCARIGWFMGDIKEHAVVASAFISYR
jgi:hypothetical protein